MRAAGGRPQSRDACPPPALASSPSSPLGHASRSSLSSPAPTSCSSPQSSLPVLALPGETCGGGVFAEEHAQEGEGRLQADEAGEACFAAEDVRGARSCQQCSLTSSCQAPYLHNFPQGCRKEPARDLDSLFPDSVQSLCGEVRHDVVTCPHKASSSWRSWGHGDRGMWPQPAGGEERRAAQRRPGQRSSGHRGQAGVRGQAEGMSPVSIRMCRQWLGLGLALATFLYVLLTCNSALWSSLHLQQTPLPNTLPGSGFRKLLEEQEKSRLAVNVSRSGLAQRLPSCIIIGVRKCGTRALLEFMDLHPDIVTAVDEMHFFNDDERYRLGLEWYRHLMPLSLPHQITMEKTPGYFISPIAPSRLHRMNSSIKLIVLLRHPTTRTISDYTQIFYNKLSKNESLDAFEDIVIDRDTGGVNTRYKAVQISMYHHHFRHWTEVFPPQQIHVVDGDRLITDPVSEIREIENFLGIEHRIDYNLLYYNSTRGFYCMHLNATYEKCLGASKGRKHPDIQVSVIRKLNKFFQPHNKELFDLIGRSFPWS